MKNLTLVATGIQKLMRNYYKQLYEHRLDLLEEGGELLVP